MTAVYTTKLSYIRHRVLANDQTDADSQLRPVTIGQAGAMDLAAANDALFASLEQLTDEMVRAPSLLPDWTVGHVLSHIALNAEAFVNVASGLRKGELGVMYPGGAASRNQFIASGATRSAESIAEHVHDACEAYTTAWAHVGPEHDDMECATAPDTATFTAGSVPLRRQREVEVHHADCGFAWFTWRNWTDAYVDADLATQLPNVAGRRDAPIHLIDDRGEHHFVGIGADALEPVVTSRHAMLGWILNRADVAELGPIDSWMTQTKHDGKPLR
jgi:maleylpyruvate isomerase